MRPLVLLAVVLSGALLFLGGTALSQVPGVIACVALLSAAGRRCAAWLAAVQPGLADDELSAVDPEALGALGEVHRLGLATRVGASQHSLYVVLFTLVLGPMLVGSCYAGWRTIFAK